MGFMNSTKNKLNSKISWQKLFLPNGHLEGEREIMRGKKGEERPKRLK